MKMSETSLCESTNSDLLFFLLAWLLLAYTAAAAGVCVYVWVCVCSRLSGQWCYCGSSWDFWVSDDDDEENVWSGRKAWSVCVCLAVVWGHFFCLFSRSAIQTNLHPEMSSFGQSSYSTHTLYLILKMHDFSFSVCSIYHDLMKCAHLHKCVCLREFVVILNSRGCFCWSDSNLTLLSQVSCVLCNVNSLFVFTLMTPAAPSANSHN